MTKGKLCILLVIAISLLLTTAIGCKKIANLTPALMVSKAYAATIEVKSCHFSISGIVTGSDEGKWSAEVDFLSPDRMRMVIEEDGQKREMRCIGDKVYEQDSQTGEWQVLEGRDVQTTLVGVQKTAEGVQPKSIAERLKGLEAIEELPDEVIGDVTCVHYRGISPPVKGPGEYWEQIEMTIVVEVWIGKDDYLVWQQRTTTSLKVLPGPLVYSIDDQGTPAPEGTTIMTITVITEFSDFNKPVEIEAPL
jgi:hypothetical protein